MLHFVCASAQEQAAAVCGRKTVFNQLSQCAGRQVESVGREAEDWRKMTKGSKFYHFQPGWRRMVANAEDYMTSFSDVNININDIAAVTVTNVCLANA